MNDERLRELYGLGLAGRHEERGTSAGCDVPPEAMLALARGELRETERLELLDRVMASPRCQEEFALLRAIESAGRALEQDERDDHDHRDRHHGGGADEGRSCRGEVSFVCELRPVAVPFPASSAAPASAASGAPRTGSHPAAPTPVRPMARVSRPLPWWRRHAMPVALAATAVLAVGLTQRDRLGFPGGGEVTRGDAESVTLLAPAAGSAAALGGGPLTFAWRPVAGATRYQFELLGADGTLVHEAGTADTTVAVARPPLEPGREYRWLVRAYDAIGAQRGSAVSTLRTRD